MSNNDQQKYREPNVMTGFGFFQETELGKALARRLPPRVTRVIDIPVDGVAKIYYASVDTVPLLDLKWDDVIEQFDVSKPSGMNTPSQKTKEFTDMIRRKIETGEICHNDIFALCELAEALDTRVNELYHQINPL